MSATASEPATVPHVRQLASWDCGIACAVAVLGSRSSAADRVDALRRIHAALDHDSIWTIEIFLLLHANGISGVLRSVNLGITATHADLSYYSQFATDSAQVTAQFAQARELGLDMREEPVALDYICERLLNREAIFVVLVDCRFLPCTRCWPQARRLRTSYAGHYVVCHGYDAERDEVCYMDPDSSADACWTKAADFERARKAEGTDEDIIEITLAMLQGRADARPLVTSIAASGSAAAGAAAAPPVAAAVATTTLTATLVADDGTTSTSAAGGGASATATDGAAAASVIAPPAAAAAADAAASSATPACTTS